MYIVIIGDNLLPMYYLITSDVHNISLKYMKTNVLLNLPSYSR